MEAGHKKRRVAIIGAGICGAATAYYLSRVPLAPEVVVFERLEEVGGRTKSMAHDELRLNLGASFFISDNLNLKGLMTAFGVPFAPALKDQQSRVAWDGSKVCYDSTTWGSLFKLLCWFGPSLFRLRRFLSARLKQFLAIYPRLEPDADPQFVFESPADFVRHVGGADEIGINGLQLCKKIGLSEAFTSTFLYGFVKGIYNNNISAINGFAMTVTLQGMFQKAFTCPSGADSLIKQMLGPRNDFCTLRLRTRVEKVAKLARSGPYRLTVRTDGRESTEELFDSVVIASPFVESRIAFENIALPPQMAMTHEPQKVEVALFEGKVNNAFFGLPKTHKPVESLVIMQQAERELGPINSFDQVRKVAEGRYLYRVEAGHPIPHKILDNLFESWTKIGEQKWDFAYPQLKTKRLDEFPPFVIDDNLYFPSAIEFASSCMEIQTIAAKNVVKMISNTDRATKQR